MTDAVYVTIGDSKAPGQDGETFVGGAERLPSAVPSPGAIRMPKLFQIVTIERDLGRPS